MRRIINDRVRNVLLNEKIQTVLVWLVLATPILVFIFFALKLLISGSAIGFKPGTDASLTVIAHIIFNVLPREVIRIIGFSLTGCYIDCILFPYFTGLVLTIFLYIISLTTSMALWSLLDKKTAWVVVRWAYVAILIIYAIIALLHGI